MVWIELYKRENGVDNNRDINLAFMLFEKPNIFKIISLSITYYLFISMFGFAFGKTHLKNKSFKEWKFLVKNNIYLGMKLRKKNNVNVDVFTCILLNYIWHIANYYKINFNSFFIYMTKKIKLSFWFSASHFKTFS